MGFRAYGYAWLTLLAAIATAAHHGDPSVQCKLPGRIGEACAKNAFGVYAAYSGLMLTLGSAFTILSLYWMAAFVLLLENREPPKVSFLFMWGAWLWVNVNGLPLAWLSNAVVFFETTRDFWVVVLVPYAIFVGLQILCVALVVTHVLHLADKKLKFDPLSVACVFAWELPRVLATCGWLNFLIMVGVFGGDTPANTFLLTFGSAALCAAAHHVLTRLYRWHQARVDELQRVDEDEEQPGWSFHLTSDKTEASI